MSEENKKPTRSNKDFAKMRVHGKKGAGKPKTKSAYIPSFYKKQHGGEHPGARPSGDRPRNSDRKPGGFKRNFDKGPRRDSRPEGSPYAKASGERSAQALPVDSAAETQTTNGGTSAPAARPEGSTQSPRSFGDRKPGFDKKRSFGDRTSGDRSLGARRDGKPGFKPRFDRDSRAPRREGSEQMRRDPAGSASPNRGARFVTSRQASPNPKDAVSPSRREAAKALFAIENGAKIADVLELKRGLIPEDEALLRELVYGCTRQKRLLDYHLNNFCATEYEKLPLEIKTALRLGLYQLLFLTRVPAHAAVYESVNLVKQAGQDKMAGFTNAVLRTIETKKTELETKGKDELDTLAIKYSHPTWVVKRWATQWPLERVEEVLKADNQPHPVFLNVTPGKREKVLEDLSKQKVQLAEVGWPENTLRLKNHEGGLFSGESFQQGDWIVQDWTPQAMLALLPIGENQRAWDVCSAPGGKTVGLAWRVGEKGHVTASDSSPERRKRLVGNIKRVGLKQVLIFDHEIEKISPAQKFDLAWVDAPCSGTGVLARRADLRWKLNLKDISAHSDQQKDLLEQAQGHLYPKGYLVYSTCSMEFEENEAVIAAFLKLHPEFKVFTLTVPEGHAEILPGEKGLTFLPTDEHDGGFISVLTRE